MQTPLWLVAVVVSAGPSLATGPSPAEAAAPLADAGPTLATCADGDQGLALVSHGAPLDAAPWARVLGEAGARLEARGVAACARERMRGQGDELVLVVSDPEVRPDRGPFLHLELMKDGVVERTARVDLVRPCRTEWAEAIATATAELWLEAPAPEAAFLDAIDSTERWRRGEEPADAEPAPPEVDPRDRVALEGALRRYSDPADEPADPPKGPPRSSTSGRAAWVEAPPMSPLVLALSGASSSLVALSVVVAAALAGAVVVAALSPLLLLAIAPTFLAGGAVAAASATLFVAGALLAAAGLAVVVPSVQGLSVAGLHAYFADGDASPYASVLAALASYASCLGFAGLGALAGLALLVLGPVGLVAGAVVLSAAAVAQATVPATFIALEHPAEKQAHHLGDRVFLRRVLRPLWTADASSQVPRTPSTTGSGPSSAEEVPVAVMAF